jgi:hypothetical protein
MMTKLSPQSLHATVREPLGLLTYCSVASVKLPRRDCWSSNNVDLLVSGFGQIYLTVKYI